MLKGDRPAPKRSQGSLARAATGFTVCLDISCPPSKDSPLSRAGLRRVYTRLCTPGIPPALLKLSMAGIIRFCQLKISPFSQLKNGP